MFGEIAMDLGVARITVLAPARRQQEIHDVQAETEVAGAGLLVQETTPGNAADVAALVDPGLEHVGIDLSPFQEDFSAIRIRLRTVFKVSASRSLR
jgi:hypothetical protein